MIQLLAWEYEGNTINEIVEKQIVETENWINTSWSMYLSTGREKFLEDTKRYKRQLSVLLAIQDVLAIHEIDEDNYTLRYAGNDNQVEYETCQCGDDYPCSTRTAITKRLGGTE